ncbi:hypothetical protein L228DRAFT_267229 [Xylona heveae TC161]|uniref:Uncharacterized protein n=1 Tax=Xylona heveae (strain CBS 132557 / TC161) TaxID=1328760 RepID=A0A165HAI6_XYLHT|nr:hypothetical protein L228DRAFT_267229 [Xylona heveae TC161]KZF23215.1 hypothetical protein L228DRAFT_267229 [Xylona heveae TC161]
MPGPAAHSIPTVLPSLQPTELLDHVLALPAHCNGHATPPITLIICSTREAFLEDLLACIQDAQLHPHRPVAVDSNPDPDPDPDLDLDLQHDFTASTAQHPVDQQRQHQHQRSEDEKARLQSQVHPLLIPKLSTLKASRAVKLAFCPSIAHLRAYLSTWTLVAYRAQEPSDNGLGAGAGPDGQRHGERNSARLLIYNSVTMHRDTSEYSVQGLSRTFAAAVEAAARAKARLEFVERPDVVQTSDLVDQSTDESWTTRREREREWEGNDLLHAGTENETETGTGTGTGYGTRTEHDVHGQGQGQSHVQRHIHEQDSSRKQERKRKEAWDDLVPILNTNLRNRAPATASESWTTTTTTNEADHGRGLRLPIRKIIQRWCVFETSL